MQSADRSPAEESLVKWEDKNKKAPSAKSLHKFILQNDRSIHSLRKRVDKIAEKTRGIDEKYIQQMERRHRELEQKFQALIEKVTVVTEVCFFARNKDLDDKKRIALLSAAISALDEPDDFFDRTDSISVKGWAKRVLDKYREKKLLRITNDLIEVPE